jgi:uncharacterized protein YdaU (DUF1376 family)
MPFMGVQMSQKAKVWFPFYVGDYLADTMHLTTQEHGAYLLILCHQWRQGHIDEAELTSVCRLDADTWSNTYVRLKKLLSIDQEGRWFSSRLDREKATWTEKHEKAREKARKAIQTRWSRQRERKAKENQGGNKPDTPSITPDDSHVLPGNYPSPSPVNPPPLRSGGEAGSPPELGAGDAAPKSEKPANKAGTAQNGRGASGTRQNARMDAARHRNAVALSAKPAPVVADAMARRLDWLLREVKEFWVRFNVPDLAQKRVLEAVDLDRCPWSERDQQAAVELLSAAPGLNEVDIRRCLEHRSISIEHGWLAASLQPSKWLRDLPSFLTTPLNGFGDALPRDGGGSYKRKPTK